MTVLDCRDPQAWGPALDEAVHALRRGEVVVVPTDSGYGLAADAFDPRAVAALATAKGRPEGAPVGVLVAEPRTLDGLCTDVPEQARALAAAHWPGPLTLVCLAQPSLAWDLGATAGTVAVRVPGHDALLALLRRTGPLAVTGVRDEDGGPVTTVPDALDALVDVRWAVDAGDVPGGPPSTVVDATAPELRVLRVGALPPEVLRETAPVAEVGAA